MSWSSRQSDPPFNQLHPVLAIVIMAHLHILQERPERQIYVPPKALERRQKQEAAKETKRETGQGDSQSQSDKGEGQDLKRDAPVQQEASLAKQEREKSSSERETEEQG